jgi:hypothetical protein
MARGADCWQSTARIRLALSQKLVANATIRIGHKKTRPESLEAGRVTGNDSGRLPQEVYRQKSLGVSLCGRIARNRLTARPRLTLTRARSGRAHSGGRARPHMARFHCVMLYRRLGRMFSLCESDDWAPSNEAAARPEMISLTRMEIS